jgi:hypothetical protein
MILFDGKYYQKIFEKLLMNIAKRDKNFEMNFWLPKHQSYYGFFDV